jgi:hypothetical protein
MIHLPSTTIKPWEVIIQYEGVEATDSCRFLDAARAERYAHYHNRLRDLGIRHGTARAQFAPNN